MVRLGAISLEVQVSVNPMVIRPGMELANLTDTGLVRTINEDYYCYTEPDDDEVVPRQRPSGGSGRRHGRTHRRPGGQRSRGRYRKSRLRQRAAQDPREALVTGFRKAHAAIHDYVREHPDLKSMGTTCTAAVVRDFQLYYGHIGDSRLYLMHNGAISQVTRDHSMVNRLVEEGKLTQEEAAVHPDRNVLTAALGMQ